MEYHVGLDIKLIAQILGITINALAEKINTTPETLSRIINGKIEPSSKMIESIYSFAYDSGLRINEEKVSYYSKRCNVLLFHGSRNEIKGELSLSHSRDTVDFGTGFYTGDNYLQSLDFVSHHENSAIYLFEYKPSELKILNVDVSLEWMLYILYNRKMLAEYENTKLYKKIAKYCDGYDVIIAPIADNRMFSTIESFFKAEITTEQAFHTLNALRLGKQIVFKTNKSLKHLKMLEKLYISKPERESSIKRKIDIVEKTESEIRDITIKYLRQGLYLPELFENEENK